MFWYISDGGMEAEQLLDSTPQSVKWGVLGILMSSSR